MPRRVAQEEMNTIIYITDNTLDEKIASLCKQQLVKEAREMPIVSVSQKPIDLGLNICVGEIGRSWVCLYKQVLDGLKAVETEWVAIAEHDCLYTHDHLSFQAEDDTVFWYNRNFWFLQWPGCHRIKEFDGMFSYWGNRYALSQMVCRKELLQDTMSERLYLLGQLNGINPRVLSCGEPGIVGDKALEVIRRYAVGPKAVSLGPVLIKYLTKYTHKTFKTRIPNLDIRHSTNFTGPKRGGKRGWYLDGWGTVKDVMEGTFERAICDGGRT
jgi:hypothetical protein